MSIEDVIDARVRVAVREEVRGALREVMKELKASGSDDLLDVEGASRILGVHPETLRGWVRDGKLPKRKLGRELRFTHEDIRTLSKAEESPTTSTAEARATAILNRKRGG